MSETIDKTKRPELKVTDELQSSAEADELSSDISAPNVAELAPKSLKDSNPAQAGGTLALAANGFAGR